MQNKSQVAGVLSIVSGVWGVIEAFCMVVAILFLRYIFNTPDFYYDTDSRGVFQIMALVYGILGFVYLIIGGIAIAGGVYALKKKSWGMALAGAICGILTLALNYLPQDPLPDDNACT